MRRSLGLLALLACLVAPAAAVAHGTVESGVFGIVHKDGFGLGPTEFDYTLRQGGRTLDVLPTQLGSAGHGDQVEIRGREEDGHLVGRVAAAAPQPAPALGERKLGVILVNWASDPREPWTPEQVRERIFTDADSMDAFYREQTHGKISFSGDVLGWHTIDAPASPCDSQFSNWTNLALQAAGTQAYGYHHLMFVFPPADCGWAGMGHVGGPYSWINGTLDVRVTAHEIGHNLGLHHANGLACTAGGAPVSLSDSCTNYEYADPFDVMGGAGSRHSHGWHLQRLGVLEPSHVKTVTESGTYTMHAALDGTTGPTTLRIPKTRGPGGTVLDWYYLEVRGSGGVFEDFSLSDPVVNGVTVRVNDDPSQTIQSRLVDANPGGTGWFWDAPFSAGSTFSDGDLDVGVVSASGGEATVAITLPEPTPDTAAPTVPTGLTATALPTGASLTWSASNDDRGVASYVVYRDGVQIGSTAATHWADMTAAPGPHAYAVAAEDEAGNRSALSVPAVATVPTRPTQGASPGSASPRKPATRRPAPPRPAAKAPRADRSAPRVRVSRSRRPGRRLVVRVRATDAGGVRSVELFLGGKRRRQARLASDPVAGSLRWVVRAPRRARSGLVRVTDTSGNSSSVSFRLPR